MSIRTLIDGLASDDVLQRRLAAKTLSQIPAMGAIMERDERDISDAIAPLAVTLFDEDLEVRQHASSALRSARQDRQDIALAMPALLRCLADERSDLRLASVLILRDAVIDGLDATPYESQIANLLSDDVEKAKWGAADTLAYHWASRKEWSRLRELLQHNDLDVVQETAGTLAEFWFRFDYRSLIPDLLALLSADSIELQVVLARAIAHRPRNAMDLEAVISTLVDLLCQNDHSIRVAILNYLGIGIKNWFHHQPQIKERENLTPKDRERMAPAMQALPVIESVLSGQKNEGRAAAIRALGHFLTSLPVSEIDRHEHWVELINKHLDSPVVEIQKETARVLTLCWLRRGRWDELQALLISGSEDAQHQVMITLADDLALPEPAFAPLVPTLLDMVRAPDSRLTYLTQRALGRLDPAGLLEAVEAGPIDSEASWSLLKELRGKVYQALVEPLKRELITRQSPLDKIALLIKQLEHPQAALRAWAAEALWEIALNAEISTAVPPLIQVLDDLDTATRAAAALALGDASRRSSIAMAYDALMRLTRDVSGRVRKNAFRALEMAAEAGGEIGALVPALDKTLRAASHEESRSEAARLLASAAIQGSSLQAQVPNLAAALDDDYQNARFYAARALYYALKGGDDIQSAVIPLTKALLDPDSRVADWAAVVLKDYVTDQLRAREVLEAVQGLNGRCPQLGRVAKACERWSKA